MKIFKNKYIFWVLVFLLYVYIYFDSKDNNFDSKNDNQAFMHWAWENEPWLCVLIIVMFSGMIALIYWIGRKNLNKKDI